MNTKTSYLQPEDTITREPRERVRVLRRTTVAPSLLRLELERPTSWNFKAGQYIWLVLPDRTKRTGSIDRRAFSIASSPDASTIELLIRTTKSAYHQALQHLNTRSSVDIIGPFGSTFVPPTNGAVFISGGAGIAPFLSLLRGSTPGDFVLFAYSSSNRPLHCADELQRISFQPHRQIFFNTNPPASPDFSSLPKTGDRRPIFISGTEDFVTSVYDLLSQRRVDLRRCRFEAHYPRQPETQDIDRIFSTIDDQGNIIGAPAEMVTAIHQHTTRPTPTVQRLGMRFVPLVLSVVLLIAVTAGWQDMTQARQLSWTSVLTFFVAVLALFYAYRQRLHFRAIQQHLDEQHRLLAHVGASLQLSDMFVQISSQTSNHVIVTDHHGRILYANHAAELLTGYTFGEMRGQTPRLWGGLMSAEYYQALWRRKSAGEIVSHQLTNRRRNGSIYHALGRITPIIRHDTIVGYVATEEDITEMKTIDKAKTEFVSLASHQLRTPLTAINWFTELLLDRVTGRLNPKQTTYVQEISSGSHRMVTLVNALLNVSRIEMGKLDIRPTPTDFVALARETVRQTAPLAAMKHQRLTIQTARSIPQIPLDQKLMRIVLENLITNAIKYTPDRGTIRLKIKHTQRQSLLTIQDTGYGIPINQQAQIFTKLFRADNVASKVTDGTGLGLYITKAIVEYCGGKIWFESKENVGTTFFVTLPDRGMRPQSGGRELIEQLKG